MMHVATMSAADPLRLRLRQMLQDKGISQSRLCQLLTAATGEPWLIQRMGKLLNGQILLRVEDLVLMARAADISLVEIVREPGKEFMADLTPSELKMIHTMRDRPDVEPILSGLAAKFAEQAPKRKKSRAVIREQMRRMRRDDD